MGVQVGGISALCDITRGWLAELNSLSVKYNRNKEFKVKINEKVHSAHSLTDAK